MPEAEDRNTGHPKPARVAQLAQVAQGRLVQSQRCDGDERVVRRAALETNELAGWVDPL